MTDSEFAIGKGFFASVLVRHKLEWLTHTQKSERLPQVWAWQAFVEWRRGEEQLIL